MTANHSIDPAQFLSEHLERAEPDLLRSMLKTFVDALMAAEADALCGAPYGARSEERVNSRNGYRAREWNTTFSGRSPRSVIAMTRASWTRSARMCSSMAQPITRREWASMTVARYSHPSQVRRYVMSYADLRTMPTVPVMAQVIRTAEVWNVDIAA